MQKSVTTHKEKLVMPAGWALKKQSLQRYFFILAMARISKLANAVLCKAQKVSLKNLFANLTFSKPIMRV